MNTRLTLAAVAALSLSLSMPAQASDALFGTLSRLNQSKEQLDFAVASGFRSKHLVEYNNFNEANHGLGLRFKDGWTVGWYYNSVRRHSIYAGREFQWNIAGPDWAKLNVGVVVGGVTGYEDGISPGGVKHGVHVLLLPEVVLSMRHAELALFYIPALSKTPTTLAAQLRVKF